ncbi:MFS-type transporter involved in bile tolerance (Atg22 family) [Amphibacillus cookii]|nr:MFS-type transporter involved in bile tolerance (Atg22 family) [Amphibacillus cookii]
MSLTTSLTGNAQFSILAIIPLFLIGGVIFISLPKETPIDNQGKIGFYQTEKQSS